MNIVLAITVHPRAGGEHVRFTDLDGYQSGSSPRGRGTPEYAELQHRYRRFIPARAGNTPIRSWTPSLHDGSSPRGRGTREHRATARFLFRFIPARAGNTHPGRLGCLRTAVHPRAGGEHSSGMNGAPSQSGSSPRGRGTPGSPITRRTRRRFIPARAGNTDSACARDSSGSGSSPRGRGTQAQARRPTLAHRFIPARAGNTSSHNALNQFVFLKIKNPTEFGAADHDSGTTPGLNISSPVDNGRNRTSFMPSTSTGTRRFLPHVSKSYPASVGAAQAIMASPSSISSLTCAQIISRVRRE